MDSKVPLASPTMSAQKGPLLDTDPDVASHFGILSEQLTQYYAGVGECGKSDDYKTFMEKFAQVWGKFGHTPGKNCVVVITVKSWMQRDDGEEMQDEMWGNSDLLGLLLGIFEASEGEQKDPRVGKEESSGVDKRDNLVEAMSGALTHEQKSRITVCKLMCDGLKSERVRKVLTTELSIRTLHAAVGTAETCIYALVNICKVLLVMCTDSPFAQQCAFKEGVGTTMRRLKDSHEHPLLRSVAESLLSILPDHANEDSVGADRGAPIVIEDNEESVGAERNDPILIEDDKT